MSLQEKIIYQYKQLYPNDTLREISFKTNIQITRVFRLLNGKKMRLEEYESFHSAIAKKDLVSKNNFASKIFRECLDSLPQNEIQEICDHVSRRLFIKKLQPETLNYSKYLKLN